jgi:DNA modification methylase
MTRKIRGSQALDRRKGPLGELSVQYVPAGNLRPDPRNPRIHSDKQIKQIAESISTFGFIAPILVDTDLNVIAGHGRLFASKLLGIEKVPVIKLEHLTAQQRQAYVIADNRLSETSTWNEQLLGEQLKVLSEVDLNFSLESIGFETAEIDIFIENLSPATSGKGDPADLLPEASPIQVSQQGDLWMLGKHRIICGSALDSQCYLKLMRGQKANVVFADPPYNVRISGHVSGNGKIQHREFLMGSGEMSDAEFSTFLTDALSLAARHTKKGSLHYVCMDWRHMTDLLAAGLGVYSELKNLCVWAKHNAGMGSFYRSQHELIFVFQNGVGSYRNNIELGRYGRSRSNIWSYPGANSFSYTSHGENLLALHPTCKPVALVSDAIMDCTARRDVVLDPFLGSGTSVIAAERVGRICHGIELDSGYVDTAIRRWQKFTGLEASHQQTGKTFSNCEEESLNGKQ